MLPLTGQRLSPVCTAYKTPAWSCNLQSDGAANRPLVLRLRTQNAYTELLHTNIFPGEPLLVNKRVKYLRPVKANTNVAPCKGIQNPGNVYLWEMFNFACGIQNPGLWNPEYSSRNPKYDFKDWNSESKFHWQRLESSTCNLESTASNPISKTVLDSLTWGEKWYSGTSSIVRGNDMSWRMCRLKYRRLAGILYFQIFKGQNNRMF